MTGHFHWTDRPNVILLILFSLAHRWGFKLESIFLVLSGPVLDFLFALRGSALALESGFRLRIGVVAQERKNHHTNIRALMNNGFPLVPETKPNKRFTYIKKHRKVGCARKKAFAEAKNLNPRLKEALLFLSYP